MIREASGIDERQVLRLDARAEHRREESGVAQRGRDGQIHLQLGRVDDPPPAQLLREPAHWQAGSQRCDARRQMHLTQQRRGGARLPL